MSMVLVFFPRLLVDDLTRRMDEAKGLLGRCRVMVSLSLGEGEGEEDGDEYEELCRAQSKTERALERLRRAAVRFVDASTPKRGSVGTEKRLEAVKELLEGIVRVYEESGVSRSRAKSNVINILSYS